jgi:hypothetical protein
MRADDEQVAKIEYEKCVPGSVYPVKATAGCDIGGNGYYWHGGLVAYGTSETDANIYLVDAAKNLRDWCEDIIKKAGMEA